MMANEKQKVKRMLQGVVLSNKADKTIVVLVERKVKHSVTGKYVKRSSGVHVHDESGLCKEGDIVQIAESRPISRTKSWILVKVVSRNGVLSK